MQIIEKYETALQRGLDALLKNHYFFLADRWWDVFYGIPDWYIEESFWRFYDESKK